MVGMGTTVMVGMRTNYEDRVGMGTKSSLCHSLIANVTHYPVKH